MKTAIFAIVDDDEVFRMTAAHIIRKTSVGRDVLVFENGQQAMDHLKTHNEEADKLPDIILLDLNMPILDGWEFLEAYLPIKEQLAKKSTIYIVTSSIDKSDQEKAEKISTIKGYIVKPIRRENIEEMVRSMVK